MLVPNDPGFALLTNDRWYSKIQNLAKSLTASSYASPPPAEVLAGKQPLWVKPETPLPRTKKPKTKKPKTPLAIRRGLNSTELYDIEDVESEYDEYVHLLLARYAGPILTKPAETEAQATDVQHQESLHLAEPTMKTIVRNAVNQGVARPTGR